ncbi:MAG TPA: hypothetical protein VK866_07835, partial [Acidimicrobiales bacterium]|nr:hypothetical protein [Acidimicrobiales bacterium]
LALAAELDDVTAPSTIELTDDPVLGSYQVVAVAPLGPADRQRLLAVPGAGARLALAGELLADEITVLGARLSLGPLGDDGFEPPS